ncbi:ABC transporter ATP-binding protein [Chthonobacter albigriseus]|uniref:ABC transporter ATP-binding protein n=1 Tax=Chthonobacter albigriseus TaxID=1683161 RepID=UPI0015EECB55|nr:ABC transporter ATP-binding protein [Chthonobacter albigriseus]
MLEVSGIDCFYGDVQVLRGLSLSLKTGEVLCLMGRNGAGKTTALKAIMGLVRARAGRIVLDGVDIGHLPAHEVPRQGIGYVPQGRRLFSELTVRENLLIGQMTRKTGPAALERAVHLFPVLKERMEQRSGTLSGGEQQMLAMARALCLEPKVLLLDEPTEGLMPSMIAAIRQSVIELKRHDVATILVEQRVDAVLPVADRVAFVENGTVRDTLPVEAVRADHGLIDRYVGVGH